jgi:hypothetical protein
LQLSSGGTRVEETVLPSRFACFAKEAFEMNEETTPETAPEAAPEAAAAPEAQAAAAEAAATDAPASSDPLSAVADAMQSAASSVTEGASAAKDAAAKALPSVGLFANRLVYTTCYTVSYGVVFPLALVALSVPQNNPLVHGLVDGSRAARGKVDEILGGQTDAAEAPAT